MEHPVEKNNCGTPCKQEYITNFLLLFVSVTTRIEVKLDNVHIMTEKSPGIQLDVTVDKYVYILFGLD